MDANEMMWATAAGDEAAERNQRTYTLAKVAAQQAGWAFLAAALSPEEFDARYELVAERVSSAVGQISPADTALLDQVKTSLREDHGLLLSARKQQRITTLAADWADETGPLFTLATRGEVSDLLGDEIEALGSAATDRTDIADLGELYRLALGREPNFSVEAAEYDPSDIPPGREFDQAAYDAGDQDGYYGDNAGLETHGNSPDYQRGREHGLETAQDEKMRPNDYHDSALHTAVRPVHEIARDIHADWSSRGKGVNYAAKPYLDAMHSLQSGSDRYGMDPGSDIIRYFLSNARSYTGPKAKQLKDELKQHLATKTSTAAVQGPYYVRRIAGRFHVVDALGERLSGARGHDTAAEARQQQGELYATAEYHYIRENNGKWEIWQKGTGKTLSTHDSKEDAEEAFRGMMRSMHGGALHVAGYSVVYTDTRDGQQRTINHPTTGQPYKKQETAQQAADRVRGYGVADPESIKVIEAMRALAVDEDAFGADRYQHTPAPTKPDWVHDEFDSANVAPVGDTTGIDNHADGDELKPTAPWLVAQEALGPQARPIGTITNNGALVWKAPTTLTITADNPFAYTGPGTPGSGQSPMGPPMMPGPEDNDPNNLAQNYLLPNADGTGTDDTNPSLSDMPQADGTNLMPMPSPSDDPTATTGTPVGFTGSRNFAAAPDKLDRIAAQVYAANPGLTLRQCVALAERTVKAQAAA